MSDAVTVPAGRAFLMGLVLIATLSGCADDPVTAGPTHPPIPRRPVPLPPDPRPTLMVESVSLDVEDVPVTQVVAQLARGRGIEIVHADGLNADLLARPVTVRLERVSPASALHWVLQSAGLTYTFHENWVVVTESARMSADEVDRADRFRANLDRTWRPALERDLLQNKLTVDIENIPAAEVFDLVREHYRLNCIAPPPFLRKTVTLNVEERPLVEVLDVLAEAMNARWTLEYEAVHFSPL